MAVEIDLKVYRDATRQKDLGCVRLYFGKALPSQADGWHWVEQNGMKVNPPWALDNNSGLRWKVVARETLMKWVTDGFLSPDPWGNDSSGNFLNEYPKAAVFELSFLDWS